MFKCWKATLLLSMWSLQDLFSNNGAKAVSARHPLLFEQLPIDNVAIGLNGTPLSSA